MSGASSKKAAWFGLLEPPPPPEALPRRPDDPRLGEVIETWDGDPAALHPGRPVLVGFPQDEGVRRNGGRVGAAAAPDAIRQQLRRLTPWDGRWGVELPSLLDAGNVHCDADLEATQSRLGEVVGQVLSAGAVPVVLGGGHETAYGHYLGYVTAGLQAGIINLDAHLDVRPLMEGQGHSGTPFRQALEHPTHPLPGEHYVCLGAQPHSVSRQHLQWLEQRGGVVCWAELAREFFLMERFTLAVQRLQAAGCQVCVTLDADVVHARDVPGVSAPNALGLDGTRVTWCAYLAGRERCVRSFELVEINPRYDRDHQSVRWAAAVVWNFLAGLALRPTAPQ